QPQRELDEVRKALIALVLEVVLGGPQRVVPEVVHELSDVAGTEERLAEPGVVIAPRIGRRALQADVLELDLANVQSVDSLDHRSPLRVCRIRIDQISSRGPAAVDDERRPG